MLVTSLANISPHSTGFLFLVFIVSFAVQNLLSLSGSHLFISVLISITIIISIPLPFNLNFHKVGLRPSSTRADLVPVSARVCLELGSTGAGLKS